MFKLFVISFYLLSFLSNAMGINESIKPELSASSPLTCHFCKKSSPSSLARCSLCQKIYYCNRQCQTNDWKMHKPNCEELRRTPGEKRLKQGRYVEAIYLFGKDTANKLVDGNRLDLIKKSKHEFLESMHRGLQSSFSVFSINNRATALLNLYHQQMEWCPLAHLESPQAIADFLGTGNTVVTPIVQTLPELLSPRFSKVVAVDLSLKQINFSMCLSKALNADSLNQFMNETLDILEKTCSKQWDDSLSDELMNEMKAQFLHLVTLEKRDNISYFNEDLFNLVERHRNELGRYPEVVFLSTIPMWDLEKWPQRYEIIRTWIEQDVTVVFSLFDLDEQNKLNFIDCFRDIASIDQMVDERHGTLYIKLTKKADTAL